MASHADWIEHALEMEGESYLKTPEEELSWIKLNNADVYAALAALLAAALAIAYLTLMQVRRSIALIRPEQPDSTKKVL